MKASFHNKTSARRPWQRRMEIARRIGASPFSGDSVYHDKQSLRKPRRRETDRAE